jgi:NhaB family Na+:H+ antiporter
MAHTFAEAFRKNFLGNSPDWYKTTIIGFLIINPIIASYDPFIAGWVLILQFIFTLAMALKCYPLQPGGLLAVEAIILGLATPEMVFHEAEVNFPVIMLLMFMVAGIYFLREMLLFTFTKILLGVRSKVLLSVLFSFTAAFLSAFLDALTVTAVIITVAAGFFGVYHKVASGKKFDHDHDPTTDDQVVELHREDLENFRAFLRSLMMHGAVGTALGGVTTLVGEPQNLLIAEVMDWEFATFFLKMAHISMPVLVVGLLTCIMLEVTKIFGYGAQLSPKVRQVLEEFDHDMSSKRTREEKMVIVVQGVVALVLIFALGFHLAEPGVVGLLVIVLATAFNGVTEEHRIGHAFEEALPFTALLVVFFAIVAVIHNQELFSPVIHWVMTYEGKTQEALFYLANGGLSMISDNVFVATVYIGEVQQMYQAGEITREQFDGLAVAINTGTNIPSVATPNGQAAFLFLLTSALAPLIRLSYGKMVIMASRAWRPCGTSAK